MITVDLMRALWVTSLLQFVDPGDLDDLEFIEDYRVKLVKLGSLVPSLAENKAYLAITANTEGTRAFLLSAYAQSYTELTENAE